jgi:hypothetical protein
MPTPDSPLDAAVRTFAGERHYSQATLERWLCLPPTDRVALLELAQELRPSENQFRDLWDWAGEIAQRDRISLSVMFASAPLLAVRRRRVSRNDKLKLLKAALRRLRFPQLAGVEDRLAALVRELGLPANIRIILPEFLEGDTIRVEVTAGSTAALQAAAERLLAAAGSAACTAIFELMEEAPDDGLSLSQKPSTGRGSPAA